MQYDTREKLSKTRSFVQLVQIKLESCLNNTIREKIKLFNEPKTP